MTCAGWRDVPPRCTDYFAEDSKDARFHGKKGRIMPEYEIVYLSQGSGVFQSKETGDLEVKAGDVFLTFPGIWHNYHPHATTGWKESWVSFNGAQPDHLMRCNILSPRSPVFHVGLDCEVHGMFQQVLDAAFARPLIANEIISSLCMVILAYALATTHSLAGEGNRTDPKVQKARHYLEEHLPEDIDMGDLAASLNWSYRHFRRLFKEATGLSPHHYHVQMRVNRAKELLEDPRLRVSQIAHTLGFADQYYFSRLFKKSTGFSPSQWRLVRGRIVA